jgi:putative heme transporter
MGKVASFLLRLIRRRPVIQWGEAALRFRSKMLLVLRTRGLLLAASEVISQVSLFLVFLASLRFVGVPESVISTPRVLAVFAFVRLGTAVPIIPGNLGIVELGWCSGS